MDTLRCPFSQDRSSDLCPIAPGHAMHRFQRGVDLGRELSSKVDQLCAHVSVPGDEEKTHPVTAAISRLVVSHSRPAGAQHARRVERVTADACQRRQLQTVVRQRTVAANGRRETATVGQHAPRTEMASGPLCYIGRSHPTQLCKGATHAWKLQGQRGHDECHGQRDGRIGFCTRATTAARKASSLCQRLGPSGEKRRARWSHHDRNAISRSPSGCDVGSDVKVISHPRLGGLRGGRLRGGQLGPDLVPVVRAQVFARDGAVGGALDGDAALNGNRANTLRPLPHELRLRLDCARQLRLAAML